MNLAILSLLSLWSATAGDPAEPLCVDRAPCSLEETLDAGQDAQGHTLQVKHLSLGWVVREDVGGSQTRKFGPGRKAEGERGNGDCSADEWWLVRSGSAPQLLLAACNDGYGASGVGDDVVDVGANRFSHTRNGGSTMRWSESSTLQLSPLALMSTGGSSYATFDPDRQTGGEWDAAKLMGSHSVPAPRCEEEEGTPDTSVYSQEELSVPLLPQVNMDKAYLQEGWKQAALGSCALVAEHFVLGKAGSAKDAALKVLLAAKGTLVLEVRDNRWTGPSDKWLADDHVELWLDSTSPGELNACSKPTAEQRPEQWALRVADGKLFPAYGSPKGTLQVEKVELREAGVLVGYRLKVVLPKPFQGIAVLYSDSDSGKKQERLLGTSAVKFARPETLNAVEVVDPAQATCEVRDGALAVKLTPLKATQPDDAVLPLSSK
ncbi:hypothetical protein P2318_19850 [Myxococcaceae bacterium GXIMD 01537]